MSTAKMTAAAKAAQGKLVTEAKRRAGRIVKNAQALELDLKWMAENLGWQLLGYDSFPAMIKGESGAAPSAELVHMMFVAIAPVMNTSMDGYRPNGHTGKEVGRMLGLHNTTISALYVQYRGKVPPEHMSRTAGSVASERIARFGEGRARGRPQQIGAGPNELVSVGFKLPRYIRDWYRNEAKIDLSQPDGITEAEMYRKVLIAHMDKVEAGRKASRRTSRSRGKAA